MLGVQVLGLRSLNRSQSPASDSMLVIRFPPRNRGQPYWPELIQENEG